MNKSLVAILLLILGYFGCSQERYTQGRIIYETSCANCHMADGAGLGKLYPDLSKSEYLRSLKTALPCLIKNGVQSEKLNTVYMPAHPQIEEASMTNLINFLSHKWGDKQAVKLSDVVNQLDACNR